MRQNRKGASAVEFALVAPMLTLMLFAPLEAAFGFYLQNQMVQVSREAARNLALDLMTTEEAKTYVETQMQKSFDLGFDVSVVEPIPDDPANRDFIVTTSLKSGEIKKITFYGIFDQESLTVSATMRSIVEVAGS